MYKTSIWVQRYSSDAKSAYTIIDDDFEEVVTDDNDDAKYGHDTFLYRTLTKGIIDVYSKRGASTAKIAKCLLAAFKGVQTGSSGNFTVARMIQISQSIEPRFKTYEEHIKLLLVFS
jgi:hypothetical protein